MQEYESIIFEQYDIEVISTRKVRGAVLCEAEQGLFLLKEAQGETRHFTGLCRLYEYLEEQNWCGVDRILPNKEEKYITEARDGAKYLLKKWYAGKECDVRKTGEILNATGMLAKLHLIMPQNVNWEVAKAEPIDQIYQRHNREMNRVRKFARGISPKGTFEVEFLKCFEEVAAWATAAENLLEEFEYQKFLEENIQKGYLVHGEYNYHNVLMNEGVVAITNFEKFKANIQVEDLYYFLRKIMEKYGWKERLGDNMLNAYSAVKPLTEKELEYIKIRLVYPEKIWKIANSYYQSNKAWVSAKNVEKLEVAIRQSKEKERFLKNIFACNL